MRPPRTRIRTSVALGALAALGAFACSSEGTVGSGPPPEPDVSAWVASSDGTMPLVLVAPHGGDLAPAGLPDRACAGCETANDLATRELADEIAAAFERRTGRRPFVVANRLHRRKFDANRDAAEATGGHAPLVPLWDLFHTRIDSAKARAVRVHPRALLVDLHGHGHAIARLELGYLLTAADLRLPDSLLTPLSAQSSVARLHATAISGDGGAALLRGPRALGTRFDAAGVDAVPSAAIPAPLDGEPYFTGGYNTQRHGSRSGGEVDAVQLECHFPGVRDSASSRTAFAETFVTVMLRFLEDQYGWTAP